MRFHRPHTRRALAIVAAATMGVSGLANSQPAHASTLAPTAINGAARAAAAQITAPTAGGFAVLDADKSYTVTGTGTAANTVKLTLTAGTGTLPADPITIDNAGNWTAKITAAEAGSATLTAQEQSQTGTDDPVDVGTPASVTYTVQAAAVDPVVTAPTADPGATTTTISGTKAAGETVKLTVNGTEVPVAFVEGTTWTVEAPVKAGDNAIVASTFYADNPTNKSADITSTLKVGLAAPTLTTTQAIINADGTVDIAGTAPGATGLTIAVASGTATTGDATVDGEGNWTAKLADVSAGEIGLSLTSAGANNAASAATTVNFTAEAKPADPVIEAPTVDSTAVVPTGSETVNVKVSGTTGDGTKVSLVLDTGVVVEATVAGTAWFYNFTDVAIGDHTVKATAVSAANAENKSAEVSHAFKVAAQTAAPVISTPVEAAQLPAGSKPITIAGTGVKDNKVSVTVDSGTAVEATVGEDGNWTVNAPDAGLAAGEHTISATQSLADGSNGSVAATRKYTVVAAVAPTVDAPVADSKVVSTDGKIAISGTGTTGETIDVAIDGAGGATKTVTVVDGKWSLEDVVAEDGERAVTLQAKFGTNNVGEAVTHKFTVESKIAAPAVTTPVTETPIASGPGDVTVTGTTVAGAKVSVKLDGGEAVDATVTDATWTHTFTGVMAGEHTVKATAISGTNPENLSTEVSHVFTVAAQTAAPVISTPADAAQLPAGSKPITITGTGVATNKVTVKVDGTAVDAVTVDADGTWTVNAPDAGLAAGDHTITATQSLADATNVSPEVTRTYTVVAAVPPTVDAPVADSTVISTDGKIAISGTGTTGETIDVTIDGEGGATKTVTVADGKWSLADVVAADGARKVTLQAKLGANIVGDAVTHNFTVESKIAAPAVTTPATDTPIAAGPGDVTVTGTAVANAKVSITLTGATAVEATANAEGKWTATLPAVAAGEHSLAVVATSSTNAANVSDPTTHTFTVAAALPAAVIATPAADGDTVITKAKAATVSGTFTEGETVKVALDDGTEVNATVVADAKTWSLDLTALEPGEHKISVVVTNAAGNKSVATVRTFKSEEAIGAPTITTPTADASLAAGVTTTSVEGTSPAGSVVKLTVNGEDVAVTPDATTGVWKAENVAVKVGENTVSVTAASATTPTNISAAVESKFTGVAPLTTPTVTTPATDGDLVITEDGKTSISGDVPAGTTIEVKVDGGEAKPATVTDGKWTLDLTDLASREHTITVVAKDATGGTSLEATRTFVAEAKVVTPKITGPAQDAELDPGTTTTMVSGTGTVGDKIKVTVTKQAEPVPTVPGSTITKAFAAADIAPLETVVDVAGNWSVDVAGLEAGKFTVEAVASGTGTNVSAPATSAFSVAAVLADPTIATPTADQVFLAGTKTAKLTGGYTEGDTVMVSVNGAEAVKATLDAAAKTWTVDAATAVVGPNTFTVQATNVGTKDASKVVTGTFSVKAALADPTIDTPTEGQIFPSTTDKVTLSGTSTEGDKVKVTVDDGTAVDVTVADGKWTLADQAFAPGAHTVKVQATNPVDGVSVVVERKFTVEAKLATPVIETPAADAVVVTIDGKVTVTGTAPGASKVLLTLDSATEPVEVPVVDGKWTHDFAGVDNGVHTLSASSVNAIGSVSDASAQQQFTAEAKAEAPVINTPVADQVFPVGTTDVEVTGIGTDGDVITVTIGDKKVEATVVEGKWTAAFVGMEPGDFEATAVAKRGEGNLSDPSSVKFKILAPVEVPVISTPTADQVLPLGTTKTTASGTAVAGDSITVKLDDVEVAKVVADATGKWVTPEFAVTEGAHTLTAVAERAGSSSAPATVNFSVETRAETPVFTAPAADDLQPIGTAKVTLTGTATAGDKVVVSLGGAVVGEAVVGADGNWTLADVAVKAGDNAFTAVAQRSATNVSEAASLTVKVDQVAAPTLTNPLNGAVLPVGTQKVDLAGKADPTAVVTLTVNGVVAGTATADADGVWMLADVAAKVGDNAIVAVAQRGGVDSAEIKSSFTVDKIATPVVLTPSENDVQKLGTTKVDVTGIGTPGDTIEVVIGGVVVGSAKVGDNYMWTVAGVAVKPGLNTYAVHALRGGSLSDDVNRKVVVEVQVPNPSFVTPAANQRFAFGTKTFNITGTSANSATITVAIDGKTIGIVKADSWGRWALNDVALTGPWHKLSATAQLSATNVSAEVSRLYSVENQAAMPKIVAPANNAALPETTKSVVVSGTASPGDTVRVKINGSSFAPVNVGADGKWKTLATTGLGAGKHTLTAVATAKGNSANISAQTTSTFSVAAPKPKLVLFKTVTSDNLYKLTGSGASTRAVAINFAEWAAAGYPKPTQAPSTYVKYSWSNDIYAVNFWNAAPESWTWQKLNLADWQKAGSPKPSVAGWIEGTKLFKNKNSNDLFAELNGTVHKLTFEEWRVMGFRPFTVR